ncbi:CBD9-like protein [Sanghuangporus baumii]|uniref:CBD9-like protein n=1 Tax=Sanghuangporus baumii TaxID=108892 RepID=A0A9Q5N9Y6_SANBA|nr:CBD9-like protein [Sanghuangporus baumii]
MRLPTIFALLPIILSAVARSPGEDDDFNGNGHGGNDDDDNSSGATPSTTSSASSSSGSSATLSTTSSASSSSSSSAASSGLTGQTGDSQCSDVMCVSAVVNGGTVSYILQSTSSSTLGWMAMGFGSQMANSPMVIMWTNSDGSVTLSQRIASGHVEPSVDSSPSRVATLLSNITSTSGATPEFAYSVPANSDTTQSVIWAFSSTNPGDSSTSASLQEHDSFGTFSLDLTKTLSSGSSSTDPASSSGSSTVPLLGFQKLVIAHAVLLGVAFLILLPAGALLARWLRTFSPHWFIGHWIIQFYLAGALIVVGVALGIAAVSNAGAQHLNDDHKRWGIAIFVLYFVQCALGGIIHFIKPAPRRNDTRTRPPQNYAHAVIGLLVIGLSFYQVRTGYKGEWESMGRGPAPKGVNEAWIAWVVVLPILYAAGLALLPRQYRQERDAQTGHGVPLGLMTAHSPLTRTVQVGEPVAGMRDVDGFSPIDDKRNDGVSSHGHGDPYADDVGLTTSGRRDRRNNSGGHSVSISSRHL